jgi:hypothetical protein
MECWLELISVGDGLVRFAGHNSFTASGEAVVASSQLRFRSRAELTDSLSKAGLIVIQRRVGLLAILGGVAQQVDLALDLARGEGFGQA